MYLDFETNSVVERFATTCAKSQVKDFSRNEVITTYIEKRNQVCILISR